MGSTWFGGLARVIAVAAILVGAVVLAYPAPARAAFACTGLVEDATIRESLVVPAGQKCVLIDTIVRGVVTVEPGGQLIASGDSVIRGSVTATGHHVLNLGGIEVRGNVTATGGVGEQTIVIETVVRGDVTIAGNNQVAIRVTLADIRGSLTVDANTASEIALLANAITTDLSCVGNTPAPSNEGQPNVVGGAKLGQCVGL